jgi:hypothetical protein
VTAADAASRLDFILAHAWMIRTFLKHADEVQDSEEFLEVPRLLFDTIRAVEPARTRGDTADFLRRLRGKLPKLRRASEFFSANFKSVSVHTNFEMAALSLAGCVRQMEEIFAALDAEKSAHDAPMSPP